VLDPSLSREFLYYFGPFCLDPANATLLHNETAKRLQPKTFEVLFVLVQNAGHLVTYETLIQMVWGSEVHNQSLRWQVSRLRDSLGVDRSQTKYIETVPKRGFRFIAQVERVAVGGKDPRQEHTSIAVLPFKLQGVSSRYKFLESGMAYTLTAMLSSLKELVVRQTRAVRRCWLEEQDPIKVGRKLGVEWILEGEFKVRKDRISVVGRLINVESGKSKWEKRFDETYEDLFVAQDSMSQDLVAFLTGKSEHDPLRPTLTRHSTESTEAYRNYIQGREFWNQRTSDGLQSAIKYFERASEADSEYALAYGGLADCYNLLSYYSGLHPKEVFRKAEKFAEMALYLDKTLAEAHTSLAYAISRCHWKWKEAEQGYKRAIELNPSYPTAHQWYGEHLTAMGRFNEAKAEVRKAEQLDPNSAVISSAIGTVHYFAREYDAAIDQYLRTIRKYPGFVRVHFRLCRAYVQKKMFPEAFSECQKALQLSLGRTKEIVELGQAYAIAGQPEQARQIIGELEQISKDSYVSEYNIAIVFVGLNDFPEAIRWLEEAYWSRDPWLEHLNVDPRLDELRREAKFKDILRDVGLPDRTLI